MIVISRKQQPGMQVNPHTTFLGKGFCAQLQHHSIVQMLHCLLPLLQHHLHVGEQSIGRRTGFQPRTKLPNGLRVPWPLRYWCGKYTPWPRHVNRAVCPFTVFTASLEHSCPVRCKFNQPAIAAHSTIDTFSQGDSLAGTRVLLLTAKGRDTDVAKGLALGADAYMTKPFSTKALAEKVKDLLEPR